MVEQLGLAIMLRSRKPASASRIDFGHDQRHVLVHAELRGIVDHHAACRRGARRMDLGHRGAGREQAEVAALEVEILERAHREHPILAEADLLAGRASGCERHRLVDRELPLREDVQHLVPDRAGRADHRNPVAHVPQPASEVSVIRWRSGQRRQGHSAAALARCPYARTRGSMMAGTGQTEIWNGTVDRSGVPSRRREVAARTCQSHPANLPDARRTCLGLTQKTS